MNTTFQILLSLWAAAVAIPTAMLFFECVVGLFARRPEALVEDLSPRPSVALVIPAHNEQQLIGSTVRSLVVQLRAGDRLIVVADNCDDATATVAREAGATVLERNNREQRGKGYALSHGVDHLREAPPAVVVFFDADCVVDVGVVDRLAREATQFNRPIQATYLLDSPASAGAKGIVSMLAFAVKNAARPGGLAVLGLPCLLTGTGMAFPWKLIESAPLASGHLVEDMQLGLQLLRAGHGPKLCRSVTIRGQMAGDSRSAFVQRTRWEHGHLGMICSLAVPLLFHGLRRLRVDVIATAFDLIVPPLAMLVALWISGTGAAAAFGVITGNWAIAATFGTTGAMIAIAVAAAWWRCGRHIPIGALLSVPGYVLWKIPLYFRFLFKRETTWVRTARDSAAGHG